MKKITLLLCCAIFVLQQSRAQFPQAVKDSVLKLMVYPSGRYSINLTFKAEDYAPDMSKEDLYKLTKEQLLARKTGAYTDASLHKALFVKIFYEEKDEAEGTKHLNQAADLYQQWINAEPSNTKPVDELMLLFLVSKNYQMMPALLDYALQIFDKHLPLLHQAVYYNQYIHKDYNKSQQYIDIALAIDTTNVATLQHQVTMIGLLQLQDIQQGKPIDYIAIPALQKALQAKPKDIGLQHLDQYHRLFTVYLAGISRAMKVDTKDTKLFAYFNLTPEEITTVNNAEAWMQKAVAVKGRNHTQLLGNLGVAACMKGNYAQAASYFNEAYLDSKSSNDLESEIMCHFFMDNYARMENLLLDKIALSKDPLDYGSLLKVYHQYTLNKAGQLSLVKKLEGLATNHPAKNQVLAAGYLILGQLEPLVNLLASMDEGTAEELSIKLAVAIITGKHTQAATYMEKWLQLDPTDEKAMAAKSITGL